MASRALPPPTASGDKGPGRAWPQPDPISQESEPRPLEHVFVHARGGRGFKAWCPGKVSETDVAAAAEHESPLCWALRGPAESQLRSE